jgi:hypothetical protein
MGKLNETVLSSKPKKMQNWDTPRNLVKYFEVLAGAISWGFKSPSPHQILKELGLLGRLRRDVTWPKSYRPSSGSALAVAA